MPGNKPGRIDVQFHFSPEFYTERVKQEGRYITSDGFSVENALAYMDAYGIRAGVMSVSTPGVDFMPVAESIAMARRLNDAAAEIARANPGRFGNFATLPMLDVKRSLAEIDYCLDELGMDGVCFMSNVGGKYPGHADFAPILDELNRRKAVVYIHPTDPAYVKVKMAPVMEWPFDTARAAVDLMYSNTIRRCPDISFILAHAGGALPMVQRRVLAMSFMYKPDPLPIAAPQTTAEIAKFYYDLAISAHPNSLGALRGITDMNHVLFACDWPFAPKPALDTNVQGFEALNLTQEERVAIEYGTAAKLFPRLFQ